MAALQESKEEQTRLHNHIKLFLSQSQDLPTKGLVENIEYGTPRVLQVALQGEIVIVLVNRVSFSHYLLG